MVPAFNPMSCPNLAVSAEVMQHVVQVESNANPLAIGVVGGRLERQPRNLAEAVATVRMLEAKGYDYSLGIAQVNRRNLARYGLDTIPEAFDACANLAAGARILAGCYGRSGGDWGKAFSCYYSGNFTTGYRDGYVQRVYAAISASAPRVAEPIFVYPQTRKDAGRHRTGAQPAVEPDTPAYRISMRSVAIDSTAEALVSALTRKAAPVGGKAATVPAEPEAAATVTAKSGASPVFVPRVSGPDDLPLSSTNASEASLAGIPPVSSAQSRQTAAPSQEPPDAAFVF
jgi:type IV secretion system protein VirB1